MYFTTNTYNPGLLMLMESFDQIILVSDEAFSIRYMASAIDAAYHDLLPSFFAIETRAGEWEMLSGNKTLNAIRQYLSGGEAYPEDGMIEDLRGKKFNELSRVTKRKLGNKTIPINMFVLFSGNKGKEDSFRAFVKSAITLI
jgi:hypothetical protein